MTESYEKDKVLYEGIYKVLEGRGIQDGKVRVIEERSCVTVWLHMTDGSRVLLGWAEHAYVNQCIEYAALTKHELCENGGNGKFPDAMPSFQQRQFTPKEKAK